MEAIGFCSSEDVSRLVWLVNVAMGLSLRRTVSGAVDMYVCPETGCRLWVNKMEQGFWCKRYRSIDFFFGGYVGAAAGWVPRLRAVEGIYFAQVVRDLPDDPY